MLHFTSKLQSLSKKLNQKKKHILNEVTFVAWVVLPKHVISKSFFFQNHNTFKWNPNAYEI